MQRPVVDGTTHYKTVDKTRKMFANNWRAGPAFFGLPQSRASPFLWGLLSTLSPLPSFDDCGTAFNTVHFFLPLLFTNVLSAAGSPSEALFCFACVYVSR